MTDLFKQGAFDSGVNKDFDFSIPFIKIQTFKPSGKWYATKYTHLTEEHIKMINSQQGFILSERIEKGCDEMSNYFGVTSWQTEWDHVISVYGVDGFCTYLISV